eukprot:4454305-Alexandrium_andersonii.AAC.1
MTPRHPDMHSGRGSDFRRFRATERAVWPVWASWDRGLLGLRGQSASFGQGVLSEQASSSGIMHDPV